MLTSQGACPGRLWWASTGWSSYEMAHREAHLECDRAIRKLCYAVQVVVDLLLYSVVSLDAVVRTWHNRSAFVGVGAGRACVTCAQELSSRCLLAHADTNRRPLVLLNRAASGNR